MKKFLSLVLALIMTMSLVTIGASAAEYKDFTDKDEITYAEAVAVLNRLGIITGYSEGDFRPEGELTRGAAAKIIASLLIGPEAANNLTPTTAPFKDVPLDHTFAGPIAYCSTLKIINGYSDGSFQPGGTLTGYAFSKMLLGALGYDGNVEGFVGSGWNMNVMRLGGDAGLFDSISFKGNEPVNREQAAQLALNTLKATLVEYTGGLNVTAGDASVTSKPTRTYVISNQEFATHISNRKASEVGNANVTTHYTVEFGEQHFVDLRMTYDRNTYDDFGRPSNEWSYKKVTIGTFPIEPDYIYTEQMEHNVSTVTNATKARALGLVGFEVKSDSGKATTVTINGLDVKAKLTDIGEIANYTDNGTVVEVYVDDQDADWVRDVVVVKTQLMEVKRIAKDYVALDLYDSGSDGENKAALMGFNQTPIDATVDNVEVNDDYYTMLSGLKVDDLVAVVPVTVDGGTHYTVAKAYVPETVSGKLNSVETYGSNSSDPSTIGVTVGDTAYDVALWNKDLYDIDGTKLDVTTKDVTLTLDEFGNALLAKNVGATSDFMVIGGWYQSLVDGKLVNYVKGWDISGQELELNVGTNKTPYNGMKPGDLVYYTNSGVSNSYADWALYEDNTKGIFDVFNGTDTDLSTPAAYSIKASNTRIKVVDDGHVLSGTIGDRPWTNKSIKFIYVTFDNDGDVDYIEIKNGVQAATTEELKAVSNKAPNAYPNNGDFNAAQAAIEVDKGATKVEGTVKAVVIKNESNDASANNMLYIVNYKGTATKRSDDGEIVYGYTVAMNGPNGLVDDEMTIYSTKKLNRGEWARYTETQDDNFENFYTLKLVDQRLRATSTMDATLGYAGKEFVNGNKALIWVNETFVPGTSTRLDQINNNNNRQAPNVETRKQDTLGAGEDNNHLINTRNAIWVDLSGNSIGSYDDLYDLTHGTTKKFNLSDVTVSMIFNDDPTKDGFRSVAMIVVRPLESSSSVSGGSGKVVTSYEAVMAPNGNITLDMTVKMPAFAYTNATTTVPFVVRVNGNYYDQGTITAVADGTQTKIVNDFRGELTPDMDWEIILDDSDLVWSDIRVKYVVDDETTALVYKNTTDTHVAQTATSLTITADESVYALTPTGTVTILTGGTKTSGATLTPGTGYTLGATITGKDWLTVKVAGLAAVPKQYKVTVPANAPVKTYKLASAPAFDAIDGEINLEVSTNASALTNEGTTAIVQAKLASTLTNVAAYKVSINVDGKTYTKVLTDNSVWTVTSFELGKNVTVAATDIQAEEIALLDITSIEAVGTATYAVTFNRPLKEVTITAAQITTDGAYTISGAVVSGGKLIITTNQAIANSENLKISTSAGVVDADGIGLAAATDWTYTTTNGWAET